MYAVGESLVMKERGLVWEGALDPILTLSRECSRGGRGVSCWIVRARWLVFENGREFGKLACG